jgi:hypothetical protein
VKGKEDNTSGDTCNITYNQKIKKNILTTNIQWTAYKG